MNARISSIRLVKNDNGIYWLISLIDEDGNNIGTFGDENHCSDIDFRKQTFYLMKILDNWNLLNLDGQNKYYPILVENDYGRISLIANSSGDYLSFDYNAGMVLYGTGCDISGFHEEYISSITSRSGVLSAEIRSDPPGKGAYSRREVSEDLAYMGFSPLSALPVTDEKEKMGAKAFEMFVCGLLNLCNVNELIQTNNYPEVSIKLDLDNKVVAIGNSNGEEYLCITDDGYEVSGKSKSI